MDQTERYVLGLDVGATSIGWACVGLDQKERPAALLRMGVCIFKPGVEGSLTEIEAGKDQSKAVARRYARLQRRQIRRRVGRQRDLFRVLQHEQLLPDEGEGAGSKARHDILMKLDKEIEAKFGSGADASFAELPLYQLRKRALDCGLDLYELGRVLFHLSQRRGFKSTRNESDQKTENEEDDPQEVKAAIRELAKPIEERERAR